MNPNSPRPPRSALPYADALIHAYRNHARFQPAPDQGLADAEFAYAIQRAVWQDLAGAERPRAWKVAAARRDAEPIAAPIFPRCLVLGRAEFPADLFFGLGVEAEIAVRFGRDLPARPLPYSRMEILDALAGLHVAMELVDTRLADAEAAGPFWRLADNLLNGGLVVGDEVPGWRELDFSVQTARVIAGGEVIAETRGRPPLDDLFFCLPWWINHVGGALAGDIVTTGAWNGMHRLTLPDQDSIEAVVEFAGLGSARVRVGTPVTRPASRSATRPICGL